MPAAAPSCPRVVLVTGTLAEPALRRVAAELQAAEIIEPVIVALPIQVAALMTTDWLSRKLTRGAIAAAISSGDAAVDASTVSRVILPGYCRGDLAPLSAALALPVERGPVNVHDLPEHFGRKRLLRSAYTASGPGGYDIEIIAEINHAPRLPMAQIIAMAEAYRADGADVIDVGCDPLPPESLGSAEVGRPAWEGVAEVVRELRSRSFRVSVDTFHPCEVELAAKAGAELVLSVNSQTCEAAGWLSEEGIADAWRRNNGQPIEVVAIPDTPQDLASLDRTIEFLAHRGIPFRVDPIIEPIGFGFAASLGRYLDVRRRYPDVPMMMGVGNLSEMTEADSAGVNALLIGFCQELNIRSVLTTQVINWARSSVKEIDIARRLMRFAVAQGTPPKHVDDRLVMLRDAKLREVSDEELRTLAARLTDRNFRLFADADSQQIHAMNKDLHVAGGDPFVVFDQLGVTDASHAFYLGYEMAKAVIANTLGKNYVQDEALRFGAMTREETSHFERRKSDLRKPEGKDSSGKQSAD